MWYVYILLLVNWSYYIWSTDNLERRLQQHELWQVISTKNNRPLKLLFSKSYDTLKTARKIEYKIKSTKKRIYVEKFIAGEYTPMID